MHSVYWLSKPLIVLEPSVMSDNSDSSGFVKFIYDKNYDELNRCRDWPLKVLSFTSALSLASIGAMRLKSSGELAPFSTKVTLGLGLEFTCVWRILIIF